MRKNKRANKLVAACHVQELPDLGDTIKLVIGSLANVPYLGFHGKMAVKRYSKVCDGVGRWD